MLLKLMKPCGQGEYRLVPIGYQGEYLLVPIGYQGEYLLVPIGYQGEYLCNMLRARRVSLQYVTGKASIFWYMLGVGSPFISTIVN